MSVNPVRLLREKPGRFEIENRRKNRDLVSIAAYKEILRIVMLMRKDRSKTGPTKTDDLSPSH